MGDAAGFLSPSHGPQHLPMDNTPVIPEYISEPPPMFVPYANPTNGYVDSQQQGYVQRPSAPVYRNPSVPNGNGNGNGTMTPRSPMGIYSGMPSPTWPTARETTPGPATPRQIYVTSPTPPAFIQPPPFAGSGPGREGPVIPSPPDRSMTATPRQSDIRGTPHHRPISLHAGTTPISLPQSLPPIYGAGMVRKNPSTGSTSSNKSYTRFELDPMHEESRDSTPDPTTLRNTIANASLSSTQPVLPVPAPASKSKKKKKR